MLAQVEQVNLFCRVAPAQKNRVILALKRRGHVVGYLGDGINDAPSLHSADIGISVESAVDVAKACGRHDPSRTGPGRAPGRRAGRPAHLRKHHEVHHDGHQLQFRQHVQHGRGVLFLPFLPMLPMQILLNNFLYDLSEIPIPLDNVDEEYLIKPRHWDMSFIRKFMLIIGPVSSVFDFLTFFVMLRVFHAGAALFHTGWFIESMATQVLVMFIIRTRRNPFKSRPNKWLAIAGLVIVAIALLLPLSPLASYLGFVAPPLLLYVLVAAMVLVYLFMAEAAKRFFYRYLT